LLPPDYCAALAAGRLTCVPRRAGWGRGLHTGLSAGVQHGRLLQAVLQAVPHPQGSAPPKEWLSKSGLVSKIDRLNFGEYTVCFLPLSTSKGEGSLVENTGVAPCAKAHLFVLWRLSFDASVLW